MKRNGNIVRYTAEEIDQRIASGEARIDRDRIVAMTEEELEASIDYEEEGHFDNSVLYTGLPWLGGTMYLKIDDDLAEKFRALGPDYPERMNEILRAHLQRDEAKATAAD
jgi:uncharacterized protein (DUF4415 family)